MTEKAWLCLQQGGSSTEWYAYASADLAEVETFRRDCQENGAYSTTCSVEIPAEALGNRVLLFDIAEAVANAVSNQIVGGIL